MTNGFPEFKAIVADNERAARDALDRGDFVQAFLLVHTLVESLLRQFLGQTGHKHSFDALINKYEEFLQSVSYPIPTFVNELTQFNRRRNRIVHNLWRSGYTVTNKSAKQAAAGATIIYGLLIEWLETFDPDITERGFHYE